ncbi:hypothetical protein FCL40_05140 [Ferrimonas sediminicola]|uniref:DUF805 domain-containing protein n=1 Tax=Ferrimonas sediminicola TaxID=2569538 RepID=A0A4U1BIC8_9GAMM|nr:hypothetical protein [Ferrimonas sediminicola]TKB50536.1 hypothetical protein FCL40_05140 [Ferrimonas sediminicola]
MKTLFCVKGQDSPLRFAAIQGMALLGCAAIISLFLGVPLVARYLALSLAIGLYPVLRASSERRAHECGTVGWPVALPLAATLVFIAAIPYLTSGMAMLLLVVWAGAVAQLALRPTNRLLDTVQVNGYRGPMVQSVASVVNRNRVEPSLAGSSVAAPESPVLAEESQDLPAGTVLYLQLWRHSLNLSALPATAKGALGLVLMSALAAPLVPGMLAQMAAAEPEATPVEQSSEPVVAERPRAEAELKMPDSYWLWMTKGALTVRWQGDETAAGPLWDYATAEGDSSCAELVFNDDSAYRPYRVEVEADSFFMASFSPMDTEIIIKQLARRGSFSLCGYDFSLKGSTKALKSQSYFEWYLNQ